MRDQPGACAEFATIAGWDRQLFPSYIVATAAVHGQDEKVRAADNPNVIGNGSGILGIRLRAPKDTALEDGNCTFISVADARKQGILPIAFRSDAKFTPVPAADDSADDDSADDSESEH